MPNEYNGLQESSACSWAIQGFTSQGWLNVQQNLILIENYVKRLEEQRDFYERQLKDRYEQEQKDE